MPACLYCGQGLNTFSYGNLHAECLAERNRRDRDGLCLVCGKRNATWGGWCEACRDSDSPQYLGYPGRIPNA